MVPFVQFSRTSAWSLLAAIATIYLCSPPDVIAQLWLEGHENSTEQQNFFEIQKKFNEYWEGKSPTKGSGWKQFKRWEYFWEPRVKPNGEFPSLMIAANEAAEFAAKNPRQAHTLASVWNPLGPTAVPDNVPSIQRSGGLGRINSVTIDPNNAQRILVGAAGGGVWESTNGGSTWRTFTISMVQTLGVSDIAIAPSDSRVMYVATGDAAGGLYYPAYSVGVITTNNSGATWTQTQLNYELSQSITIARLLVHPTNSKLVLAAANNGIWRTTNSGAAWTNVQSGHFKDLEFNPIDPNIVMATSYSPNGNTAIYRSTDGGLAWSQATTFNDVYRTALAVTKANPNLVYAVCANTNARFKGFYRSTDAGATWNLMYQGLNLLGGAVSGTDNLGQGWYDLAIAASPINQNEVYIGGINIWRSTNGGSAWSIATHWYGDMGVPFVHADHHSMVYSADGLAMYCGNDGGLKRLNTSVGDWTDLSSGLNIMQVYKISNASPASNPNLLFAGAQDNGTNRFDGSSWMQVFGGDGMMTVMNPNNPNNVFVSTYSGRFYRSNDGGSSFNEITPTSAYPGAWVTPLVIDMTTPTTLYAGYRQVWRTTNSGTTWQSISSFSGSGNLTSLAIAPSDSKVLYAVRNTTIHRTTDGGTIWIPILQDGSSEPFVSNITVDPVNPFHVWITRSGFEAGKKVYEYNGSTWTNISANLPNVPANCIARQTGNDERVYLGTDLGVFYRDYTSSTWTQYNDGLGNVAVSDLQIQPLTSKIRAATYGLGIWEAALVGCSGASATITPAGSLSFCQGDSLSLDAGSFTTYLWSNGLRTRTISVKTGGDYYVSVTDQNGCTITSSSVTVTVKSLPSKPTVTRNDIALTASLSSNYQWNRDGDPIPGATSKTYLVPRSGRYSVTVTNSNGCSNTSDEIDMQVSSVDHIAKPHAVVVYPIPSSGTFTVSAEIEGIASIRLVVTDASGTMVFNSEEGRVSGAWQQQLKLESLPVGTYLLRVMIGNTESVHKLIKK